MWQGNCSGFVPGVHNKGRHPRWWIPDPDPVAPCDPSSDPCGPWHRPNALTTPSRRVILPAPWARRVIMRFGTRKAPALPDRSLTALFPISPDRPRSGRNVRMPIPPPARRGMPFPFFAACRGNPTLFPPGGARADAPVRLRDWSGAGRIGDPVSSGCRRAGCRSAPPPRRVAAP